MENNSETIGDEEAMHWLFGPDQEEDDDNREQESQTRTDRTSTEGDVIPAATENPNEPGEKRFNELYYRCRAAREKQNATKMVETASKTTVGQEVMKSDTISRGKLEDTKEVIGSCFVGSRLKDREKVVNQTVCMSIDPRMTKCIVCKTEHDILTGDKRSKGFLLSDQNSFEKVCGENTCLAVIRIEDGGLLELVELLEEVVGGKRLETGTIIGLGSLSYLEKVGTTCYCLEWVECVERVKKRFPQAQLVPLAPIPLGELPGTLAVELVQVAFWFSKVYEGSLDGLHPTWVALVRLLTSLYDTGELLEKETNRIVALPSSVKPGSKMVPQRFVESHIVKEKIEIKQEDRLQLLRILRGVLAKDFGLLGFLRSNAEKDQCPEDAKEIVKIVLLGASNMARTAVILREMGYSVSEARVKTGLLTQSDLEEIQKGLSVLNKQDTAVVLDLHGNLSFRFEQVDGTNALPVYIAGKHHLPGPIRLVDKQAVTGMIRKTLGLLKGSSDLTTVVVPPIPRYINGGCCEEKGHSLNVKDNNYAVDLINELRQVRKVYKTELTGGKSWVLDPIGALIEKENTSSEEAVEELRSLYVEDNVHLNRLGYERLAKGIVNGINRAITMSRNRDTSSTVSGTRALWHGLESERGARRVPDGHFWRGPARRGGRGQGSGPAARGYSSKGQRDAPYYRRGR